MLLYPTYVAATLHLKYGHFVTQANPYHKKKLGMGEVKLRTVLDASIIVVTIQQIKCEPEKLSIRITFLISHKYAVCMFET